MDLLKEAKSLESYLTDTARKDLKLNEYERRRDELTKTFQDILKEEWGRVKMGELWWRIRRFWRRITSHSSRRSQVRAA